jgi:hypothetical protein
VSLGRLIVAILRNFAARNCCKGRRYRQSSVQNPLQSRTGLATAGRFSRCTPESRPCCCLGCQYPGKPKHESASATHQRQGRKEVVSTHCVIIRRKSNRALPSTTKSPQGSGRFPLQQLRQLGAVGSNPPRPCGRRIGREIADIEHRPRQFGFRQHGLRLRHDVPGGALAAGKMVVELDLGQVLAEAAAVCCHHARLAR